MRYAHNESHLSPPSKSGLLVAIYLPWVFAECLVLYPIISYIGAWLGSFLIFYLTLISPMKFHSIDRPLQFQVARPIALIQLIFAGFMCCTSIFYFIEHYSHRPLIRVTASTFQADQQTIMLAKAQRISLLAHSTLVTGIILCTKLLPAVRYKLRIYNDGILYRLCVITYLIGTAVGYMPGLIQFKYMLVSISVSVSAYILLKGLVQKKAGYLIFGGSAFLVNFLNTTLTGYKEPIIISTILLGFLAFPFYKRTVIVLCIPCTYLLIYILPTFTNIIRLQSWNQGKTKENAREQAFETFFDEENENLIIENSWSFLTNRFSEVDMFTIYIKNVPDQRSYYSFDILISSLNALIPRIFWENKPDTEKVAMERVYDSGVAHRSSPVSAKTRPVIDGYLSAGIPGVLIYMLAYGMLAQTICNIAEKLFGGYDLGCIIIFNSIFQPMWRGNTMEFLMNNILYGLILMLIIHLILKRCKLLVPTV